MNSKVISAGGLANLIACKGIYPATVWDSCFTAYGRTMGATWLPIASNWRNIKNCAITEKSPVNTVKIWLLLRSTHSIRASVCSLLSIALDVPRICSGKIPLIITLIAAQRHCPSVTNVKNKYYIYNKV